MTPEARRRRREQGLAKVQQFVAEAEQRRRDREREYRQRDRYRLRPASRRVHRFVATTGALSSGRVLDMSGCDLRRHHANPVVLWNHDGKQLPVGRADLFVDAGHLIADVTFDRRDPMGRTLHRKYRRGFMHGISIAYDSFDYRIDEVGVFLVTHWEPTEMSAVSVPADANAVCIRRARGPLARVGEVLRR